MGTSCRNITDSRLYKSVKKEFEKAAEGLKAARKEIDESVEEARKRSQPTLENKLAAERKQVLKKYPECNNYDNARWIWKRADRALDEGISSTWSKERRKEYYELQLQSVNIEALWPSEEVDPEEEFAWRERQRQEYEKILLQLEYGDGLLAKVLHEHKKISKSISDEDVT